MQSRLRFIISLFFAFFAIGSSIVCAKVVTIEQATFIAEAFFNQHLTRNVQGDLRLLWDDSDMSSLTRGSGTRERLFYVFEPLEGSGFVIVSADDRVMPILGYSFEDAAPKPDDLPLPMYDWIIGVSEQINSVKRNNVVDSDMAKMWAIAKAGNVVVELETAKWNQHAPYNNQCPYDGSERSVAGCVPVAVAIVMRYHKWPEYAVGVAEGYHTVTKGIYVPSRDLNHSYDWELMPLMYIPQNYSEEEAEAVSTLIADVGMAFQADFTKDATSSYTNLNALYEHFGYNPGMSQVARENYSDDVWLRMIKDEINELRPVLYSGRSGDNGGHQFVVDGYTDDDYFHINWGWGGYSNGYFTLSTLTPDDRGGYNDGQWACFDVKPNTSVEVDDWIKFKAPGIVLSNSDIAQNSRFYFDELNFVNNTAADFSGFVRGAVTNRDGAVKEWITNELEINLQNGGWYVRYKTIGATITQNIDVGDRIRFFYKSQDSDTWQLMKSNNESGCTWEVLVADEYYISESTSFVFDKKNGLIILKTKTGVDIQLLSSTGEDLSDLLSFEDGCVKIEVKKLLNDTYILKLQKGDDVKMLNFAIKSN